MCTFTKKFRYEVRKQGSDAILIYGTKSEQAASGSFNIVNCVADLKAGDYELELIAMGTNGCPSTGEGRLKTFTIYELPTATVKEEHRKDSVCYKAFPNDGKWNVTYSASENTDSLHYWLKNEDLTELTPAKHAGVLKNAQGHCVCHQVPA